MNFWREIIAERRKDFIAKAVFLLCKGFSVVYRLVIAIRNSAYDKKLAASLRAPLPVISIGNITAGGTGKTPLVIWLCNHLAAKGIHCAVLSRGYKGKSGDADEPALIRKSCPECEVLIGSKRYENALQASQNPKTKALILDDGFQHRRLARDLNILTIDASCPFGYERLLPAGLLREPLSQIKRADAAVITRCDIASKDQIRYIIWKLCRYNPEIIITKAAHKYSGITMLDGNALKISEIVGKKCFVFCGIGNPEAFFACLKQHNINIHASHIFPDHHNYTSQDVNYILTKAQDCDIILATEKDLVKLSKMGNEDFASKCGSTDFEISFLEGLPQLIELIDNKLQNRDKP